LNVGVKGELTESDAFLALNAVPRLGPIALNRLLAAFDGDPRAVLSAGTDKLENIPDLRPGAIAALIRGRRRIDPARERRRMAECGAEFIARPDAGYPELLEHIPDPPLGLYRKGSYAFTRPAVAVVGTRRATPYGAATAAWFASALARLGVCIVSGLARGIDTAAHEGALAVGGATVGVLGTGIDLVYPPENARLFARIAETGAILSEFPCGCPANKQTFPMRNRIVSGLCAAILVVESDVKGGAMITARMAGEQGRIVCAVPGRIDQRTSAGCHQLIRDGAVLVASADELLQELDYLTGLRPSVTKSASRSQVEKPADLSPDEAGLLECFRGGGVLNADQLAARSRLSASQVSAALMLLEIKRLVARRIDGSYEARSDL